MEHLQSSTPVTHQKCLITIRWRNRTSYISKSLQFAVGREILAALREKKLLAGFLFIAKFGLSSIFSHLVLFNGS